MEEYYRKRVAEYEEIYYRSDPGRKEANKKLANSLQSFLKDKDVLEVACGTGYWTQILSRTACSILATDSVSEVLDFARKKQYFCPVTFKIQDAYSTQKCIKLLYGASLTLSA